MVVICTLKALGWNLSLFTDYTEYSNTTTSFLYFILKTAHFTSLSLPSSFPNVLPRRQSISLEGRAGTTWKT
jgi:hypothetical protein